MNNKNKIRTILPAVVAVGSLGYAAVHEAVATSKGNSHVVATKTYGDYGDKALANEAQVPVTVQAGQGLDAVIESVDPQAAERPELLRSLEKYVQNQVGGPGHQLEQGETVDVPALKN